MVERVRCAGDAARARAVQTSVQTSKPRHFGATALAVECGKSQDPYPRLPMPIEVENFVRADYENSPDYAAVHEVATRFVEHLHEPEAQELIAAANVPGVSSAFVQEAVLAQHRPSAS
jgi:hypothetical protein